MKVSGIVMRTGGRTLVFWPNEGGCYFYDEEGRAYDFGVILQRLAEQHPEARVPEHDEDKPKGPGKEVLG